MASAKYADATEPERSNRADDREGEADFGPKPRNDQQLASNRLHPRPERRIVPRVSSCGGRARGARW